MGLSSTLVFAMLMVSSIGFCWATGYTCLSLSECQGETGAVFTVYRRQPLCCHAGDKFFFTSPAPGSSQRGATCDCKSKGNSATNYNIDGHDVHAILSSGGYTCLARSECQGETGAVFTAYMGQPLCCHAGDKFFITSPAPGSSQRGATCDCKPKGNSATNYNIDGHDVHAILSSGGYTCLAQSECQGETGAVFTAYMGQPLCCHAGDKFFITSPAPGSSHRGATCDCKSKGNSATNYNIDGHDVHAILSSGGYTCLARSECQGETGAVFTAYMGQPLCCHAGDKFFITSPAPGSSQRGATCDCKPKGNSATNYNIDGHDVHAILSSGGYTCLARSECQGETGAVFTAYMGQPLCCHAGDKFFFTSPAPGSSQRGATCDCKPKGNSATNYNIDGHDVHAILSSGGGSSKELKKTLFDLFGEGK